MPVKQLRLTWLWLLPLLLLFSVLVVQRIDSDGLWYDEVFTVMNAGGAAFGPLSMEGIYEQIVTEDPFQAPGYVWTVAIWGFFVGWSDMALRWSSFIFALLTIVMTYRIGRDHLTHTSGLFAALIVGFSSFTFFYAHELRAFTMMPMCVAILVWGYSGWLRGRNGRLTQFAIFGGATLLLYTHYFGGLLLIGLSVYHLLFVTKNARWWRPVFLLGGAAIAFLPVIPMLLEGIAAYTPDEVPGEKLTILSAIDDMLYYLGNNAMLLTSGVLLAGVWRAIRERKVVAMWIILTIFSLIVLLILNAILENMTDERLRYSIFLWVPAALWAGAGMEFIVTEIKWLLQQRHIGIIQQRPVMMAIVMVLPLLWLAHSIQAEFEPDFAESIASDTVPRLRDMTLILENEGYSSDVLAFYHGTSLDAWYMQFPMDYAIYNIPMPMFFTATRFEDTREVVEWAENRIAEASRLWYGVNRTIPSGDDDTNFLILLNQDFIYCDNYLETDELSLDLYARSDAFCPTDASELQFGDEAFILRAHDVVQTDTTLEVSMHWWQADDVPRETYNMALHLATLDDVNPVAQADVSFGYEAFSPIMTTLDISDLSAGSYELCTFVYNWHTAERFQGEHYETGATGERLCLTTITIE